MEEDKRQLQNQTGEPRPSVLVGDGKAVVAIVLGAVFLLTAVLLALLLKLAVPLAQQLIAEWNRPAPVSTEQAAFRNELEAEAGGQAWAPLVPESPDVAVAAVPAGSPGGWVTNDDYPAAARRADIEGIVGFTLSIGPDGRVSGCRVDSSSGHQVLDDATCALLTERARFHPARDSNGQPVTGHWDSRFRWMLER
ncbi:energy transducer TonB [Sphingomonas canadensis]|uniref:Energy transducer TonB n=1 Tax=Sphingomonas canadensis TaxID=1219257 RepID=A0ABW3HAU3_9SPHN|nr:energy transducer TonB [Sphingomonas canadensis]MCW3837865.1 energy transducer TonB [Sphingomonas canadensis]